MVQLEAGAADSVCRILNSEVASAGRWQVWPSLRGRVLLVAAAEVSRYRVSMASAATTAIIAAEF
jgi:hypothetical protein